MARVVKLGIKRPGLPVEWIRKITHGNAAALYRHPLPERCPP